jgi:hypothetical protein
MMLRSGLLFDSESGGHMMAIRSLVFLAVYVLFPQLVLAQEFYELAVDGRPDLASQAQLEGARLTIQDSTGSTFVYDRHPAFDTTDGELLGFRSLTAGASIRWPVAGAGRMWISDFNGAMWKKSLQSVKRVGGAVPIPGTPAVFGPGGIACLPGVGGNAWAAHVGSDGKLRCFQGAAGTWKHRTIPLTTPLVPGAPLAMFPSSGAWPGILTIAPSGRLLSILDGSSVQIVSTSVNFPPGAYVKYQRIGPHGHAFAIDTQGRLWDIDMETHIGVMVEPAVGAFPPGAPLAVLMDGPVPVVVAVNNASVLLAYGRLPGGWSPTTVGAGYTPGTHVAAANLTTIGPPQAYITAVNWAGQLQLWEKSGINWTLNAIPTVVLAPGSPVEIGHATFGPLLSAIGADGVWHAWSYVVPGGWTDAAIGPGYSLGAPMAILSNLGSLFTVDTMGRMMVAWFDATGWHVSYALPSIDFTPQLVSRRIIPNPELPPARVALMNSSEDDLIVQIVDQFQPRQPEEIKIPQRGEVVQSLARDAGGRIEEVYLAPGPLGTLIERTETYPIPPQQRYTLVVWSDKVTYRYIDRRKNKPQGATPSFDLKTHVSLGVIPIPPGSLLGEGEMVDVPAIAKRINNPGAARFYPQPVAPPVTVETKDK